MIKSPHRLVVNFGLNGNRPANGNPAFVICSMTFSGKSEATDHLRRASFKVQAVIFALNRRKRKGIGSDREILSVSETARQERIGFVRDRAYVNRVTLSTTSSSGSADAN
jgi:hypothetical protein